MKYFISILLWSIVIVGCQDNKSGLTNQTEVSKKYIQVKIPVDYKTPTVGMSSYTLVTNDIGRDSAAAQAIMRAKVILPLAMQKHDALLFDSILSQDFVSQGEDEFLDREAYIQDRVNGKWMISDVQYENLVLEFFGDIAVLTYRNIVKERDENGEQQTFHWTWTDIWVKENGAWKIKVLRAID